jgi:hypothetical protein
MKVGSWVIHPPGKKNLIIEMSCVRIVDDKMVERWLIPDILSLNQQLGLISRSEWNDSGE